MNWSNLPKLSGRLKRV